MANGEWRMANARGLGPVMNPLRGADEEREKPMQEQAGEGNEMPPGRDLSQPLVVADQPAEASCPREVALDHPAARQRDEAPVGLGVLNDLPADAFGRDGHFRRLPGRALVDEGHLDGVAGDLLYSPSASAA